MRFIPQYIFSLLLAAVIIPVGNFSIIIGAHACGWVQKCSIFFPPFFLFSFCLKCKKIFHPLLSGCLTFINLQQPIDRSCDSVHMCVCVCARNLLFFILSLICRVLPQIEIYSTFQNYFQLCSTCGVHIVMLRYLEKCDLECVQYVCVYVFVLYSIIYVCIYMCVYIYIYCKWTLYVSWWSQIFWHRLWV